MCKLYKVKINKSEKRNRKIQNYRDFNMLLSTKEQLDNYIYHFILKLTQNHRLKCKCKNLNAKKTELLFKNIKKIIGM